mmetsp:Transcript_17120/g.28670  ORF Transcript_17120/g.28670 Transcript_17120/m.28670 type:complete len:472 (+) Transcript_17120:97-1512(+)
MPYCVRLVDGVTDLCAIKLAEQLKTRRVVSLSIHGEKNEVGDIGAAALAVALKDNTFLLKLDVSGCSKIGQVGFQAIREALKFNTILSMFIFNDSESTGVSKELLQEIVSACTNNFVRRVIRKVRETEAHTEHGHLSLERHHVQIVVTPQHIEELANLLKASANLKYINLQHVGLTDEGVLVLVDALKANGVVTTLNVSGNPEVTDVSGAALKELLEVKPHLKHVIVDGTGIRRILYGELEASCRANGGGVDEAEAELEFEGEGGHDDEDGEGEEAEGEGSETPDLGPEEGDDDLEAEAEAEEEEDLESLKVAELKERLRALGQPDAGTKPKLVKRLREAMASGSSLGDTQADTGGTAASAASAALEASAAGSSQEEQRASHGKKRAAESEPEVETRAHRWRAAVSDERFDAMQVTVGRKKFGLRPDQQSELTSWLAGSWDNEWLILDKDGAPLHFLAQDGKKNKLLLDGV